MIDELSQNPEIYNFEKDVSRGDMCIKMTNIRILYQSKSPHKN